MHGKALVVLSVGVYVSVEALKLLWRDNFQNGNVSGYGSRWTSEWR